ncbi:unnamed protein product [Mytilus edulis]|uniref:Uncharacterized protein n=1 Tax=Mytilus edulis TaxID=6550 RepID=A0A8S3UQ50_MYTED|nr:unnamed protein product [Mytilus edulis]
MFLFFIVIHSIFEVITRLTGVLKFSVMGEKNGFVVTTKKMLMEFAKNVSMDIILSEVNLVIHVKKGSYGRKCADICNCEDNYRECIPMRRETDKSLADSSAFAAMDLFKTYLDNKLHSLKRELKEDTANTTDEVVKKKCTRTFAMSSSTMEIRLNSILTVR